MAGKRVLVVDDEKLIVKGIRFSLEQDNMEVDCAYDGEEALEMAHNKEYDIILLDVMLPKLTGFEVCQQIREFSNVPVIMLTAKGDDMDKILGLEYGADDYIPKPFSVPMLVARIDAVLRRSRQATEGDGKLAAGNLRINFHEYVGTRGTEELVFTRKEIEILEYLWNNRDHAVPRAELLNKVWGYENAEAVDTRTVDIHITKLRKKIENDPSHPRLLVTFRGEGYQLRATPE